MSPVDAPELESLDPYIPEPPGPPIRSQRTRAVHWLGAVLVVVLLTAGAVAATQASPGDPAKPEDAVRALLERAAAGDLAGAVDQLVDEEQVVLREPLLDLSAQFRANDITTKTTPLALDAVGFRVEALAGHVQLVHITGVDAEKLAERGDPVLGGFLRTFTGLPFDFEEGADDVAVIVVDEDGEWRPSLWYSILDTARRRAEKPVPSFASQPAAGAASPEEAARRYIEASSGGDLRDVVALSDPVQLRALHDYAPQLLPQGRDQLADLMLDLGVKVKELDLASHVDGDRATVTIERSVVTFDDSTVTYDGRCVRTDPPDPEFVPKGMECTSAAGLVSIGPSLMGLGTEVSAVRREGGWYIQPMAGALQSLAQMFTSPELADVVIDEIEESAVDAVAIMLQGPFLMGFPTLAMPPEASDGAGIEDLGGMAAIACMGEVAPDAQPAEAGEVAPQVIACADRKLAAGEISQEEYDQFKAFAHCMTQMSAAAPSSGDEELEIPACVNDLAGMGPIGTDTIEPTAP